MAAVKSVRIKNKFAALQATSIFVASLPLLLPGLGNFSLPAQYLIQILQISQLLSGPMGALLRRTTVRIINITYAT